MHDSALDYDSLLTALEKLDTEVTLGEIHGTLTGLLCAQPGGRPDIWLNNLWPERDNGDLLAQETYAQLVHLHEATQGQLNDPTCDFHLLLPGDDEAIALRVQALGDWCQGFLTGLALGGIKDLQALPDNVREIANDLLEIARAHSSYDLEEQEEDEQAYAELTEYVRVGVMLINEELHPALSVSGNQETRH